MGFRPDGGDGRGGGMRWWLYWTDSGSGEDFVFLVDVGVCGEEVEEGFG